MTYAEPGDAARPFRINARFASDELETVRAAAACAGLTPTRYVAEASLYLANTHTTRNLDPLRRVRGELFEVVDELHTLRSKLLDAGLAGVGAEQLRDLSERAALALDEVHAAAARLRTLPAL